MKTNSNLNTINEYKMTSKKLGKRKLVNCTNINLQSLPNEIISIIIIFSINQELSLMSKQMYSHYMKTKVHIMRKGFTLLLTHINDLGNSYCSKIAKDHTLFNRVAYEARKKNRNSENFTSNNESNTEPNEEEQSKNLKHGLYKCKGQTVDLLLGMAMSRLLENEFMDFISIKEFCEKYSNKAIEVLKICFHDHGVRFNHRDSYVSKSNIKNLSRLERYLIIPDRYVFNGVFFKKGSYFFKISARFANIDNLLSSYILYKSKRKKTLGCFKPPSKVILSNEEWISKYFSWKYNFQYFDIFIVYCLSQLKCICLENDLFEWDSSFKYAFPYKYESSQPNSYSNLNSHSNHPFRALFAALITQNWWLADILKHKCKWKHYLIVIKMFYSAVGQKDLTIEQEEKCFSWLMSWQTMLEE